MTEQPPALVAGGLPSLEKYELLAELGHGGMATVYRARDRRLGREVAVKVIHRHLRDDPEVAARFVAEARAAARLRHRNIVEVYDVSDEGERDRWLVVELCRGSTLRELLRQRGAFPAEVAASLVWELCAALDCAHEAGLVHRDVKPENVLVEWEEAARGEGRSEHAVHVKLTDFGIAKVLDGQGLTSTGQVLGSPAHMAPEQIEGGKVDARTDLFALGVLFYECLVGHLPFEGKNPAQVLRRVLEGDVAPAESERPTVGRTWSLLAGSLLEHDRAARPSRASALAARIEQELAALGIAAPRDELRAYLQDPEAYERALPARLLPPLLKRSEEAQRRGDVVSAAADLTRALALAPGDARAQAALRALSSAARRRRLLRRGGLGALGLLGALTSAVLLLRWGASRAPSPPLLGPPPEVRPSLSSSAEGGSSPLPGSSPASAGPTPASLRTAMPLFAPPAPSADAPALSSGVASPGVAVATLPGAVAPSRAPGGKVPESPPAGVQPSNVPPLRRQVRFKLIPAGAELRVDGRRVDWFAGGPLWLEAGTHRVQASVPGSTCCRSYDGTVVVEAGAAGAESPPQIELLKLQPLPATLRLGGGPPGGSLSCPELGVRVGAGSAKEVPMREAQWSGLCSFLGEDGATERTLRIDVRAGELNVLGWPLR